MATQAKRSHDTAADESTETTAALATATGTMNQLYQQQLAAGADVLCSMFRSAEALQQVQLQAAQRLALLHSQAAENLRTATSPMDVASVESTLGIYAFQEAMRYGQELLGALVKSGGEIMRPAQAAQDTATAASATVSPAATLMGAAMTAAVPMADAFQQMFNGQMRAAAAATQARH